MKDAVIKYSRLGWMSGVVWKHTVEENLRQANWGHWGIENTQWRKVPGRPIEELKTHSRERIKDARCFHQIFPSLVWMSARGGIHNLMETMKRILVRLFWKSRSHEVDEKLNLLRPVFNKKVNVVKTSDLNPYLYPIKGTPYSQVALIQKKAQQKKNNFIVSWNIDFFRSDVMNDRH